MTQESQEDNILEENIIEKKEEVIKTNPSIPQKNSRAPAFVHQNQFGKGGGFNNFSNNKQRPGRAASRGR